MLQQELFASNNNEEELVKILELSGFKKATYWKDKLTYIAEDVLVRILTGNQPANSISKNIPYIKSFYLELYNNLKEYPANHPLFRFFKSLDKPIALGIAGFNPEYGIREYLKLESAAYAVH